MIESSLLHELIIVSSHRNPDSAALTADTRTMDYGSLAHATTAFAQGIVDAGLRRGDRVGIYVEKRFEAIVAAFGTAAAGGIFVPINPVLKPGQVAYILRDCNVRVLVTSADRLRGLRDELAACPDLRTAVVAGTLDDDGGRAPYTMLTYEAVLEGSRSAAPHRVIDTDVVAILYTSGSTGQPKGVVLSHRNMVAGAKSVAAYLANNEYDSLLAVLPLSFDAGFSQLTTAFHAGARAVLLNYLVPRDVLNSLASERITGLTAVPPLYIQLARLEWPATIGAHLRYFANTGGRMPLETLTRLRERVPHAKPFLMYGLTEAFRSTYLPPEEVDRRPDSIGKAIPNAEIMVLREDGTTCAPGEPGELVHRGALVGLGYWNDEEKTAERYKVLRNRDSGIVLPEYAVFSGDTVRADEDGYLYFIGRRDEMIKTSGYRVSPMEIEEALYSTRLVGEAAAFGVPHPVLGQAIVVIVTVPENPRPDIAAVLTAACRESLPAYMIPARLEVRGGPLPRNPNGKIDRKALAIEFLDLFAEASSSSGGASA